MDDNDQRPFQVNRSSTRERVLIGVGFAVLVGGLALVTWNLVQRPEEGLSELRKMKVNSTVDPKRPESTTARSGEGDEAAKLMAIQHPNQKVVTFKETDLTNKGLHYLSSMKKTEQLDISATDITDAGLEYLVGLPLIDLNIGSDHCTDQAVATLSKIQTIENLDLSDVPVTDEGVCQLKNMPHLTHINVSGTNIGDKGLKCLSECKSIVFIAMASVKVTNDGLSPLLDMKGRLSTLRMPLVQLNVSGAKTLSCLNCVTELDIRHTNANDEVLHSLSAMPKLGTLNLSANPVTDKGLLYLKKSRITKLLIFDCPNITPAAIAELKKALPRLQIDSHRELQISF